MKTRQENNWSQEETAAFFDIGRTTVKRWCLLLKKTGSLEPRPRGPGYPPLIKDKGLEKIKAWVTEKPDLTIKELCARYSSQVKPVSTSTISRALGKLDLTFKKKPYRQVRRKKRMSREERENF
jgi:transposase